MDVGTSSTSSKYTDRVTYHSFLTPQYMNNTNIFLDPKFHYIIINIEKTANCVIRTKNLMTSEVTTKQNMENKYTGYWLTEIFYHQSHGRHDVALRMIDSATRIFSTANNYNMNRTPFRTTRGTFLIDDQEIMSRVSSSYQSTENRFKARTIVNVPFEYESVTIIESGSGQSSTNKGGNQNIAQPDYDGITKINEIYYEGVTSLDRKQQKSHKNSSTEESRVSRKSSSKEGSGIPENENIKGIRKSSLKKTSINSNMKENVNPEDIVLINQSMVDTLKSAIKISSKEIMKTSIHEPFIENIRPSLKNVMIDESPISINNEEEETQIFEEEQDQDNKVLDEKELIMQTVELNEAYEKDLKLSNHVPEFKPNKESEDFYFNETELAHEFKENTESDEKILNETELTHEFIRNTESDENILNELEKTHADMFNELKLEYENGNYAKEIDPELEVENQNVLHEIKNEEFKKNTEIPQDTLEEEREKVDDIPRLKEEKENFDHELEQYIEDVEQNIENISKIQNQIENSEYNIDIQNLNIKNNNQKVLENEFETQNIITDITLLIENEDKEIQEIFENKVINEEEKCKLGSEGKIHEEQKNVDFVENTETVIENFNTKQDLENNNVVVQIDLEIKKDIKQTELATETFEMETPTSKPLKEHNSFYSFIHEVDITNINDIPELNQYLYKDKYNGNADVYNQEADSNNQKNIYKNEIIDINKDFNNDNDTLTFIDINKKQDVEYNIINKRFNQISTSVIEIAFTDDI